MLVAVASELVTYGLLYEEHVQKQKIPCRETESAQYKVLSAPGLLSVMMQEEKSGNGRCPPIILIRVMLVR